MFDVFDRILSTLLALGQVFAWAIVTTTNGLVAAVGALLGLLLALLPSLPEPPSEPAAEWVGWLNWLLPIGPMLAIATTFMGMYVALLLIRVAMRWVKAL